MYKFVSLFIILFQLIGIQAKGQTNDFHIYIESSLLIYNITLNYDINKDSMAVYETNELGDINNVLIYSYRYSLLEKDTLNRIIFPFLMKMESNYDNDNIIDGVKRIIKIEYNDKCLKEIFIGNVAFKEITWLLRFSKIKSFIKR